jgi:hypothetical protein
MSNITIKGQTIYGVNPIVSDSLLLYLDAGNNKSYSGSGSTWTDLIQNNNATLTNTTFNSSNGGNLVFNGSNSSIITNSFKTVSSGSNVNNDTTNEIWYKWNGVNQLGVITYVGVGASSGYLGFLMNNGSNLGVSGNKVSVIYGGEYFNALDTGTTFATLTSSVWTQLVITKTTSICKLYQNGIFLGSTTKTQTNYTSTSPYQSAFFGGSLSIAKLYNRALTDAEVLQNYNALKGRFGL